MRRQLVVGLGNYTFPNTRHSVGSMALDYLVETMIGPGAWTFDGRLNGWIAHGQLNGPQTESFKKLLSGPSFLEALRLEPASIGEANVVFYKAKTLMNISGPSVMKAARSLSVPLSDMIVVHDDLERKLGQLSTKLSGSANGHNGIRSIADTARSLEFKRIRIGIGRPANKDQDVAQYVLSPFAPDEKVVLADDVFARKLKSMLVDLLWTRMGEQESQ
ncbi:peptidyl-tRNA hydrolase [Polychytrium aggregatum]|uniref:peptidyl-tRNA hydrolase n=1 Tax=Polychytrium aggregatum TaxID=110093 RepID=UPI0022FF17ED|nr:peptidyl-tRNA hydrolase [Polychytrium aggregatum]KAI9204735.1 peptidyl-tRNA hydrolase [Polychytrium aggregatum]